MNLKHSFYLACILLMMATVPLQAQKVTVSREIGVRNNYAYDILPNIGDRIIFYHDKGTEQQFEIYDSDLRHIQTIIPQFEKRNITPAGVITMDSTFNFYYSYRDEDTTYLNVRVYNKNLVLVDTATLSKQTKVSSLKNNPKFTFSEDKSKVLIFYPEDRDLHLRLIDNVNRRMIYEFKLTIKDINLRTDFEKLEINNRGEIFILGSKSSFWGRDNDKGFLLIRILDQSNVIIHRFFPEKDEISELLLDYDEKNQRLAVAGFVTQGDPTKVNGYFAFSIRPQDIPIEAEILINRFSSEFLAEVSGKKPGKVKELSDYQLKDIVIRNDGGVIMVCEMIKEFTRRAQINTPTQVGEYFPLRGFVDYYHEDLILIATFPDGKEHWKKILFKKQFSQDDNAIYSSYFLFKTPSRVKLIYNDEIKNNNTVSEYVLDPSGNAERRSVLSTEYQNLKLRFRDAIQTGPSTLIVPSEKSWKINMVKIEY
ncbi:MAG: hypothetical protein WAT46_12235 [Saprospiraceae bacterium]